jgi:hypothetical protein
LIHPILQQNNPQSPLFKPSQLRYIQGLVGI